MLRAIPRSIIPVIQRHRSTGQGKCCHNFEMDGGRILSSEICLISVTVTEDRFNYEMLCYPCASNQNRLFTSQQLLHHAGKISTSVAGPTESLETTTRVSENSAQRVTSFQLTCHITQVLTSSETSLPWISASPRASRPQQSRTMTALLVTKT